MLIIGGAGSVSGAVVGAVLVGAELRKQLRQLENWLNAERIELRRLRCS